MSGGTYLVAAGCTINDITGKISGLCTAKGSIHISINYPALVPFFVLGGGALVVLLLSAVLPKRPYRGLWAGLTVAAGVGTVVDGLVQWQQLNGSSVTPVTLGDQLFYDHMGAFFAVLFGVATVAGAAISDGYLEREGLDGPEPYVLMLSCSLGAVLMADAAGFVTLFLGLEILSISLYAMSAYHRWRAASGEAGLKYLILGSLASAIFIYGAALIYGATGSLQYLGVVSFLADNALFQNGVLLGGMVLVIVGLGFKVAAVPFHFWSPDVYQGAPTPFVGYMAAVAKAAGFAGLLRVLMLALPTLESTWRPIIWVLATLSVVFGSILALVQVDLKRMLAYSSISQAGYVLIGLQAGTAQGVRAVAFYLFTYTFMVIGTFAIVGVLQGRGEARNDLSAVRGLASRSPWLAGAMLVLMLGQAGIPLTSGFLGKWVVIEAVLGQGQYELALIGMLGAAVAAFFYLRVALIMFLAPESPGAPAGGAVTLSATGGPGAATAGGGPSDGGPESSEPGDSGWAAGAGRAYSGSDLQAIVTAGLSARDRALALRPPPHTRVRVPAATAAVIAVCVVFTVFAGVSTPVLSWAHAIALPWSA
ncbi:MAG: NADH-quinone oxidoreductase subunit N [Actinomycetota bacterium]|nr:NADH-quinone oxidoreductase subunit N [Actinomycetota bacterium]